MKKIFTLFTVIVVLVTADLPIFAQKKRFVEKPGLAAPVDTTTFGSVDAFSDGKGVYLRWQMSVERDNVGFNVYRINSDGQSQANDAVILGSRSRFGSDPAYGEKYYYFDPQGTTDTVYFIGSVSGAKVASGKVGVTFSSFPRVDAGLPEGSPLGTNNRKKPVYDQTQLVMPRDLNDEVIKNIPVPNALAQRSVVAQEGVKIGVAANGFYRVSRTELQNAGFDVMSDPTTWKLFANGVEQAINVEAGGNYVEFLGKAVETIESAKSFYYLVAGPGAGKRMATRVSRPGASTVYSNNYLQSYSKKERVNYISTILNGDADNYWGNVITTSTSTFTFSLSGVDLASPTSTVTINLQGFSSTPHNVNLTLNGNALTPATGSNTSPFGVTLNIPTAFLAEGTNSLQMASAASGDFSLFDSIKVDFARKFAADQNRISFYSSNYKSTRITGFASQNVRLFDTTVEGDPIQVTNLRVIPAGPLYDVELPAARGRMYYAVEDSGIRSVASIQTNYGSDLRNAANQGKLVIITHRDFLNEAEAWATYRRTADLQVIVVDVEDVFDEFNYGQPSADSINAFLSYAYSNWQAAPQYVLILGDGSYDPKNYNGFGFLNLVPSKMVNTVYEETSSDEALADFNNDGLAEIAIGRIPARTPTVVANALAMVQAFETPAMQDLNRGAIFAYDLPIGFDFAAMSQALRNELPSTMPAVFVDRAAPDSATVLINQINMGRYIVNYSGHGSTGVWAATSFFGLNSVPQLTNANSRSIFTMLTCLNGYFIRPDADSLAEALIKAQNGGAVVAWASTGKTTPDIQQIMGVRFYNQIAAGNITRMGDLVRDAKAVIPGGSDVRLSWALLGDPMLKVR